MKDIPAIKAVMTPFPHHVGLDDSLERAERLLHEHKIGHLPVTRGDEPVGILSKRDLQVARASHIGDVGALRVEQLGLQPCYVVDLHEPLDIVTLEMARRGVDAAVIVKDGRLAGIFTVTDACACLGRFLRLLFPRPDSDDIA